jgi:hypothetical protein
MRHPKATMLAVGARLRRMLDALVRPRALGTADVARLLVRRRPRRRGHRQGYDLQLTQCSDRGWRATFYTTGMEHSPTSATGTAWVLAMFVGCATDRSTAPQSAKSADVAGEPIPLDSKDPKYGDYLDRVRRMIREKWGYPCVKEKSWFGVERCDYKSADLEIEFVIARRPSTFAIYDEYAVNAIKLAAPFPPVPDSMMVRPVAGLRLRGEFKYTKPQR